MERNWFVKSFLESFISHMHIPELDYNFIRRVFSCLGIIILHVLFSLN